MGRSFCAMMVGLAVLFVVGCGDSKETRTGRAATAMVRVHLTEPVVLSPQPVLYNDAEFRAYRNSAIVGMTSEFVLQAALDLEAHALRSIPAIANSEEPLEWLRDRLEVRVLEDSEFVQIRIFEDDLSDDEMCRVANAVVVAYMSEVVDQDRRQRLSSRNEMERALHMRREECERKEKAYRDALRELGTADPREVAVTQAVLMAKLREAIRASGKLTDRLENEFIRMKTAELEAASLEDAGAADAETDQDEEAAESTAGAGGSSTADAASNDSPPSPAESGDRKDVSVFATAEGQPPYKRRYRITQTVLSRRLDELKSLQNGFERELRHLSAQSQEAIGRHRELETLAEFIKTMEQELALFDVNLLARPRVQLVQSAVVEEVE